MDLRNRHEYPGHRCNNPNCVKSHLSPQHKDEAVPCCFLNAFLLPSR